MRKKREVTPSFERKEVIPANFTTKKKKEAIHHDGKSNRRGKAHLMVKGVGCDEDGRQNDQK
jgi:hypothetical protein